MCPCFSHACPSAVKQLPWYVPLFFTRVSECCETTLLICAPVFHTPVRVLWNNSTYMFPCVSHACPSAVKQLPWYVPLSFRRLFECYKANPGSGRSCSECARGEWHQTTRARTLFSGGSTETSGYLSGSRSGKSTVLVTERLTLPLITSPHSCPFTA